jgi:AcrR family transcriptional regulator
MNIRQKITPEDMRERIVSVAEEHFRRVGYAKTAVADIAAALGMSPANVYRFFPSKSAINNAICQRMMAEVGQMIAGIAARDLPPPEKVTAFFAELHRYYRATLINEHRLHDMVEVAMAENWPSIEAHCQAMVMELAGIIAEGVANGAFRAVDPAEFAQTAFEAGAKVLHPTLIAQGLGCPSGQQDDQVARITALILAALRP